MSNMRKTALAASILLGASFANAATFDFIKLTQTVHGESAWAPLTLTDGDLTMTITGGANNDNDSEQFAYLDWGQAGLGSCKDLKDGASAGANPGSNANACRFAKDDNVNAGEYLEFVFNQDVVVDNMWFNNNHDGGFARSSRVDIDGTLYGLVRGYAGGVNGIGSFTVAAGEKFVVAFKNRQFYVSGMEVSEVPVPGTLGLFGLGLVALGALRRKVSA